MSSGVISAGTVSFLFLICNSTQQFTQKFHITQFWHATPCNFEDRYRRFGGTFCIYLYDISKMNTEFFFRNVGKHLYNNTTSHTSLPLTSDRIWNLTFLHLSFLKFLHLITNHTSDLQQPIVQENEIIRQRFQSKEKRPICAHVVFFVVL